MSAVSHAKRLQEKAGPAETANERPLLDPSETSRANVANLPTKENVSMPQQKVKTASLQRHQEPSGFQASLHGEPPPLFNMLLGLRSLSRSQQSVSSVSGNPVAELASCSSGVPTCAPLDETMATHSSDTSCDFLVLREEEDSAETPSSLKESSGWQAEDCADDKQLRDARVSGDVEPVDAETSSSVCPGGDGTKDDRHAAPSGFCMVWTRDALKVDDWAAAADDEDGDEDDLKNVSADVEVDSPDDEMVMWVGIPVNLDPATEEDGDEDNDDDDLRIVSADVELNILDDEIVMWVGVPVNLDAYVHQEDDDAVEESLLQVPDDDINCPGMTRDCLYLVNEPALRLFPSFIAAAC